MYVQTTKTAEGIVFNLNKTTRVVFSSFIQKSELFTFFTQKFFLDVLKEGSLTFQLPFKLYNDDIQKLKIYLFNFVLHVYSFNF